MPIAKLSQLRFEPCSRLVTESPERNQKPAISFPALPETFRHGRSDQSGAPKGGTVPAEGQTSLSKEKTFLSIAKINFQTMLNAPKAVDKLPLLEHNGVEIQPILHYGFSSPKKGPQPAARTLYGAKDGNGERHWRSSLDEIKQLIDKGFATESPEQ